MIDDDAKHSNRYVYSLALRYVAQNEETVVPLSEPEARIRSHINHPTGSSSGAVL